MKQLCGFKNYEIFKVYREEGVSAKNTNRPKFQEMIEDVKQGHISGRPPLGYIKRNGSKKIFIDEVQADVVRRIFKLYLDGMSVCSIYKLFKEENVLNRRWPTTTVDKILSNQLYIGNSNMEKEQTMKYKYLKMLYQQL